MLIKKILIIGLFIFLTLGLQGCVSENVKQDNSLDASQCCNNYSEVNYQKIKSNKLTKSRVDKSSPSLIIQGYKSKIFSYEIPENQNTRILTVLSLSCCSNMVHKGGIFYPSIIILDKNKNIIRKNDNFVYGIYKWGKGGFFSRFTGPAVVSKIKLPNSTKYIIVHTTQSLLNGSTAFGWDSNYYDINAARKNRRIIAYPWKYREITLPNQETGEVWVYLGDAELTKVDEI